MESFEDNQLREDNRAEIGFEDIGERKEKLIHILNKNNYTRFFSVATAISFLFALIIFFKVQIPMLSSINSLAFFGWGLLGLFSLASIVLAYQGKIKYVFILWVILALVMGIYIRTLPMQDHGGNPGLWDIVKNDWTLGPDLDPWLFTRVAGEIVEQGTIPEIDHMRNVPLGFENSRETVLLPYMIAWTHMLVNLFGEYSIEFSAALFPVIMFALTILSFFLFVREVFVKKDRGRKIKANLIALISTFFMIVIPVFLSRTIAGIPEKESAAFFFLFLSLFFFLRAWNQSNLKESIFWGVLAGISTAAMGLVSGLFSYIYVPIFIASFIAFILNKFDKTKIMVYASWWVSAAIVLSLAPGKISLLALLTSLTLSPAFFLLVLLVLHVVLWETKLSKNNFLRGLKLPRNITSLIATAGVILVGFLIVEPALIFAKLDAINQLLFEPTTGRWNTTVAENRQPYFKEWVGSFGPFMMGIPLLFWFFFIGSVVLFKKMLRKIKPRDSWSLTVMYIFFFCGLVFSRYSSSALFNGENFISKAFYLVSVLILIGGIIYYYIKYFKEGNRDFEKIDYNLLLLFSLFVITLFTARSAVRLIMVLGPIAPIFVGYILVEVFDSFRKSVNKDRRILWGIVLVIIALLTLFIFFNFYETTKNQANSFVPSHYNQQWQKAMGWVRDNTPQDAVFGHWWDYGYWVQSIGERATVLDGGNAISFWNYWMGRLVLTGDNQEDALEFLYNHNTTHFLIDSSDIGKYGAFSSIGSDETFDRYSYFGTFLVDERQTQETQGEITYIYTGGVALDEDLVLERDGSEILLPKGNAAVVGITIPFSADGASLSQPSAIMFYNGAQHNVPLRYASISGREFFDFGSGIEATAYVFPSINAGENINQNPVGAVMFISPRLMRGMLAQTYILDDPFDNFPGLNLVHSEANSIIDSLRVQGMDLPDFVHYQGIQGPIKIWEIAYTGEEELQEKYMDTDSSKYLEWKL